ncbi:MAG: beta-lactamase family protein [Alicyclobacillus shizuokensis]|nr:beta-lactamase family protein [Alicyclobacillus shizuokensis]
MIVLQEHRFKKLIDIVEDIRCRQQASAVHLCVWQQGEIVVDRHFGFGIGPDGSMPIEADSRFNVYSIRKAYMGLAFMLLVRDGVLPDLDTPVRPYIDHPRFSRISPELTFRHLVTHTHGLREASSASLAAVVQAASPGRQWEYNNAGVDLLCHIVEYATGSTVADILQEKVFAPAEISHTAWEDEGHNHLVRDVHETPGSMRLQLDRRTGAGRNLYVTARDLVAFAVLHLRRGRLKNRRIIDPSVIEHMTTCWTPSSLWHRVPSQGVFWWLNVPKPGWSEIGDNVPSGSYQIIGMNGSLCLVIPSLDAVVVRLMNKIGDPAGYNRFPDYHRLGDVATECLSRTD